MPILSTSDTKAHPTTHDMSSVLRTPSIWASGYRPRIVVPPPSSDEISSPSASALVFSTGFSDGTLVVESPSAPPPTLDSSVRFDEPPPQVFFPREDLSLRSLYRQMDYYWPCYSP